LDFFNFVEILTPVFVCVCAREREREGGGREREREREREGERVSLPRGLKWLSSHPHEVAGDGLNLLRPRGSEHEGLAIWADLADNFADLRLESHVKHSVSGGAGERERGREKVHTHTHTHTLSPPLCLQGAKFERVSAVISRSRTPSAHSDYNTMPSFIFAAQHRRPVGPRGRGRLCLCVWGGGACGSALAIETLQDTEAGRLLVRLVHGKIGQGLG
jgi:hypothetical protein